MATITGNNSNNTLTGTASNDLIRGLAGNDVINAMAGNDTIDGGVGIDTMNGGDGNDTYIVDNAGDVVGELAGEGIDLVQTSISYTLATEVENLTLTGTAGISGTGNAGDNIIIGNTAGNLLVGHSGNDTLNGGLGADTMIGGLDNDTYIVDNVSDVVVENTGEGTDTVISAVSYTLGADIENLTLSGTLAINATGNALNNTLVGNAGNNILNGALGADNMVGGLGNEVYIVDDIGDVVTELASAGTDTVKASINYTLGSNLENLTLTGTADLNGTGNAVSNAINGNVGNNTLDGAAGADKLAGGAGNDTYIVDNAGDVVTELASAGADTVLSSVNHSLLANIENLTLTGTAAINATGNTQNNTLTGNIADNNLNGGLGADTLIGGLGNDTYVIDNIGDVMVENASEGTDTVISALTHTLASDFENLTLSGTAAINGTGNAADNTIIGNAAINTLTGDAGNDVLNGGTGADRLIGGLGDDTYVVDNAADIIVENSGEGIDTIQSSLTITLGADLENATLTGTTNINATGNSFDNILIGNAGKNTLTGAAGNDTLDGGVGADRMIGGLDDDLYIVDNVSDVVAENASEGTDSVQSNITYILGANVENLALTGANAINGTGNTLNNTIAGNNANNVINGGLGADTMLGGLGNDTYFVDDAGDDITENAAEGTDTVRSTLTYVLGAELENLTLDGTSAIDGTGNTLANILTGNTAANTLDGGLGADTMIGGAGNDTYLVDDAGDVVTETLNNGSDTVISDITYSLGANIESLTLTGAGALNATGNGLANTLTGNSGVNTIDGGIGADSMIGADGDDTYIVDNVLDVVTENVAEGTDSIFANVTYTLAANIENLTLTGALAINGTGNAENNTIIGNSAANSLDGDLGADSLTGGLGDDTYFIDDAGDVVTENLNEGSDNVFSAIDYALTANVEKLTLTGTALLATGNDLANTLTGNSSNNTLDGGLGADAMAGGLGDDLYIIDNAGDIVTEAASAGTDTIQTDASYTLIANIENLVLLGTAVSGTGNALNNIITGNGADNTLNGGAGIDTLIGGTGSDTYIVDNVADVVIENASSGTDLILSSASFTASTNVENLTLTGTAVVNATGNALDNTLTGNSAANVLDGGTGSDVLVGGLGNDTYVMAGGIDLLVENASEGTDLVIVDATYNLLTNFENLTLSGVAAINGTGNASANIITGNSGNNTLNGGGGIDTLIGGVGDDTYIIDLAADVIVENADEGTDTVQSAVSYVLSSSLENLVLTGGAVINATGNSSINTITGNGANNTLDGGANTDTLIGGVGDDTYIVDNVGDIVTENASEGIDTIRTNVTYTASANVENIALTGTTAINSTGNALDNTLTGNIAANTLDGGAGADIMIGGAGNDTYIVDNVSDFATELASQGTDTVLASVTYTLSNNVENLTLTGVTAINGTGNALGNIITGNSAINTLDGAGGIDTLIGAAGNDTYIIDSTNDVIIENVGEGTDTVLAMMNYTLGDNLENLTLTGGLSLNGTGNASINIITGNVGNNTLNGGGGADTLIGGTGDDTYVVDNTLDVITENVSEGLDTVLSNATYTLAANLEKLTLTGATDINGTGNASDNTLTGNGGANTLSGAAGADVTAGGDGNDTYIVDNVGDLIIELADQGIDSVQSSVTYVLTENIEALTLTGVGVINGTGNNSSNTLIGNTAVNTLDGRLGADVMIGGAGNDTYVVDNSADVVTELAAEGTDLVQASSSYTLLSNVENLTLTGASAINGTGNALVNIITGNVGNNTLDGNIGADTMIGGLGNDTYFVDNVADVISENANEGIDTAFSNATYTLGNNVENLVLTGAAAINGTGNASINTITGNSAANILSGLAGADTMIGSFGNDTYVVDDAGDVVIEYADEGLDTVQSAITYILSSNLENLTLTGAGNIDGTGEASANTLTGNAGNNTLDGAGGADTMIGAAGNDTYIVDDLADVVTEGAAAGTDTVRASVSHTLFVNIENLTLTGTADIHGFGNAAVNIITGNNGNNTLDGGAGADTLIGGIGNDTYIVDNTTDIITEFGGEGTDVIQSSVTYTIVNNVEDMILTGSAAINGTGNTVANTISGNSGVNVLDGAAGNDRLFGFEGGDTLLGGAGNDYLSGDDGADLLTGGADADMFVFKAASAYSAIDTVSDFTLAQGDALNIADLLSGYDPLTHALQDFVEISTVGANSIVSVDRDGAGTDYGFVQIATLTGIINITDEAALVANGNLIVS